MAICKYILTYALAIKAVSLWSLITLGILEKNVNTFGKLWIYFLFTDLLQKVDGKIGVSNYRDIENFKNISACDLHGVKVAEVIRIAIP
jgi:hypothetical protein